ncbi:hypothetical protein [Paenibacillus xylanilyticus]|uniref:hypothetical protein n=1 Tax=Paenibacillus xylanilyticus TaxID=248903 RepID=UPI003AABDBF9
MKNLLTSNVHFYTAKLDSKKISVIQENEEIEQGYIEEISEVSIKIKNSWFFKNACEFYLV